MADAFDVGKALFWARMMQVVAEYLDEGTFNRAVASEALQGWTEFCRERRRDVELPPIFAELVALALAGGIGRKKPPKKLSYIERRALVKKFRAAREREGAGSYDSLLKAFSAAWGVSEGQIKTLLSQENTETPDFE